MSRGDFKTFVNNKKSIIIVVKNLLSFDQAYAGVGLHFLLKEINKTPSVILLQQDTNSYVDVFREENISISSKIEPLSYVVSIDYTKNDIEKITHDTDEKDGKIKFFIYPSDDKFNFDNVEFNKHGSDFDGVILFDVDSVVELGEFYEKNKKHISDENAFSLGSTNSYSKSIVQKLRYQENGKETRLSVNVSQNLLNGVIFSSNVFTGEKSLDKDYETVDFLVNQGASLSESLYKVYQTQESN